MPFIFSIFWSILTCHTRLWVVGACFNRESFGLWHIQHHVNPVLPSRSVFHIQMKAEGFISVIQWHLLNAEINRSSSTLNQRPSETSDPKNWTRPISPKEQVANDLHVYLNI